MKEYLFLDTSALSKGGQSLIPGYDQMRPGCVVVLSGMVLKELDLQKSRRDADSSRFARETARQIEGLLRCSQRAGDSQWKLGKCSSLKLDLSSWSAGADGDQDAAIIKQAAKFAEKHKNHGEVVLVSRDRIQRIRAMAAGLTTLDPDNLAEGCMEAEPAVGEPIWSRGNGRASVEFASVQTG